MSVKNTIKLVVFITIFIISNNSFSQTNNIETIKKIAGEEKASYDARAVNGNISLASLNFQVVYYRCKWSIDPAVRLHRWRGNVLF
jgi:hypothetical protein